MKIPIQSVGTNRNSNMRPLTAKIAPSQPNFDSGFFDPREILEGVPVAPFNCFSLFEECSRCRLQPIPPFGFLGFRQSIREVTYCFDSRFGGIQVRRGPCVERPCSPFSRI